MSDRPKRPAPARTQPIRSWSTLFAVPPADGAADASDPAEAADASRAAGLDAVVSRSVELGYRVIDEYVRQGQKVAQRLNDRSYGTQAMAGDLQDLAMRMTEYASDLAAVWLELVQRAAAANGEGAPAAGAETPGAETPTDPASAGGDTAAPAVTGAATHVRIEVSATQPVEVSLDLRPVAPHRPLLVHALRAVEPDKPRLRDVGFVAGSDDAPPTLRIRVPPGQPAGAYSGVVIDPDTSGPVGTVCVRVAPPDA